MTLRRASFAAAGVFLLVLFWYLWPRHDEDGEIGATGLGARTDAVQPTLPVPVAAPVEPRSALADGLNATHGDIHADLQIVLELVDAFRTNFPKNGNPVGDNAEITAVLSGRNRLRLALIPPDHPAINRAGELCDRWGTPFFFHAEGATKMEIRSAGPDRKMWNGDDVVQRP